MIPPKGFKSTLYPLRHKLQYSAAISGGTETINSTMFTLVKNYKTIIDPTTIQVNPKNSTFHGEDAGAVCQPMSIIDKLKLTLKFNLTKQTLTTDGIFSLRFSWMPIFFSFPEKLDATDDKSTDTVAEILSLTKDATQEDVTPAWATKLVNAGGSGLAHPVSTNNLAEVFGLMNLTTDTTMEGVPFDGNRFYQALRYYTNRGALKACIGATRRVLLTRDRPSKTYFINKFVPRAIRRIVPYSYFGILIHLPLDSDVEQSYYSTAIGASKENLGIKAICTYDEWHPDFDQDM